MYRLHLIISCLFPFSVFLHFAFICEFKQNNNNIKRYPVFQVHHSGLAFSFIVPNSRVDIRCHIAMRTGECSRMHYLFLNKINKNWQNQREPNCAKFSTSLIF
jgi:hypothetical protein